MKTNIPLLEASSLKKSYDYTLFEDINITLFSKESIAVMGRSGSGKSTLLHILSTLLKPDKGSIKLFNQDINFLKDKNLLKLRREKLGIIFQSHYLFKGMSVLENIQEASYLSNREIDFNLLKDLEIDNILNKKVGDISGGQQQRVSIARVLVKKPKIIFADEPTGNLDKITAKLVMSILSKYIIENSASLFLVTHDLEVAKQAEKIFILEDKSLHLL